MSRLLTCSERREQCELIPRVTGFKHNSISSKKMSEVPSPDGGKAPERELPADVLSLERD